MMETGAEDKVLIPTGWNDGATVWHGVMMALLWILWLGNSEEVLKLSISFLNFPQQFLGSQET